MNEEASESRELTSPRSDPLVLCDEFEPVYLTMILLVSPFPLITSQQER